MLLGQKPAIVIVVRGRISRAAVGMGMVHPDKGEFALAMFGRPLVNSVASLVGQGAPARHKGVRKLNIIKGSLKKVQRVNNYINRMTRTQWAKCPLLTHKRSAKKFHEF